MTLAEFKALENVFAAEIDGRIHQSNAKILSNLDNNGLVESLKRTLPGRFPVTITGWVLTQRGRLLFCEECSQRHPQEELQPA